MSLNAKRTHSELSDSECNGRTKLQAANGGHFDSSDEEVSFVEEEIVEEPINNAQWQTTISKVVSSVVSIHFSQVAPFDCDSALVSEATGFVVDSELGIILTNRHVVGAGPFVGYAVFDNHEECDVIPIYRDPVHDFGFLKFDPKISNICKFAHLNLSPRSRKSDPRSGSLVMTQAKSLVFWQDLSAELTGTPQITVS